MAYQRRDDQGYATSSRGYSSRTRTVRVKEYDIIETLGTGSFATVYLAKRSGPHGDTYAALKKMEVDDPTAYAEIAILSKLPSHENIAGMYEYFQHKMPGSKTKWFLALEYCGGGSLNELLAETELPLNVAFDYMKDIVSGIAHMHRHGIIHCDLKNDNILRCGGRGRDIMKVTDFSIARRLNKNGQSSTKFVPEFSFGPYYSSAPEVFDGGAVTDRSDVYSVGLILLSFFLHSAITAEDGSQYLVTPFAVDEREFGKALREVPQDEAIHMVKDYVIGPLQPIIIACLMKNSKKRPFAEDVLHAIESAQSKVDMRLAQPIESHRYSHRWSPYL